MTVPSPTTPPPRPTAGEPARKPWDKPTLARLDMSDAENSANPLGPDGLTFGS